MKGCIWVVYPGSVQWRKKWKVEDGMSINDVTIDMAAIDYDVNQWFNKSIWPQFIMMSINDVTNRYGRNWLWCQSMTLQINMAAIDYDVNQWCNKSIWSQLIMMSINDVTNNMAAIDYDVNQWCNKSIWPQLNMMSINDVTNQYGRNWLWCQSMMLQIKMAAIDYDVIIQGGWHLLWRSKSRCPSPLIMT